ncbi:MAG: S8 family serine peptidase [Pseudomonadota bacterium]
MRFDQDWLDRDMFSWNAGYALASFSQLTYSRDSAIKRALEDQWGRDTVVFASGRTKGHVAIGDEVVLVAFRGTDQIADWWSNFDVTPVESDIVGGGVHRGFLRSYDAVREMVKEALDVADPGQSKRLWFTVHSLGGALAVIAAMDHIDRNPSGVVTFGQPRSFDRPAMENIVARLGLRYDRLINEQDVVPRIPRNLGNTGRVRTLGDGGPQETENISPEEGIESAGTVETGPPPLDPAAEEVLHAQVEAAGLADDMSLEGFGGGGPGIGAEGLIPGIRHHRIALYVDRMRQAAHAARPVFRDLPGSTAAMRVEALGVEQLSMNASEDLFDGEEGGWETVSRSETAEGELTGPAADRLTSAQPIVVLARMRNWSPPDGLKIDTQVGDIVTAMASPGQIAQIEQDPGVLSIEISRDVEAVELETSGAFVGARVVQRPPISERGAHALVGIVDTGIDVLHRAFLGPDGRTRLLAIWDQFDTEGLSPADVDPAFDPDYGRLWLHNDIQNLIDGAESGGAVPGRLRDPREHGTHVAGIAAGRAVGNFADGIAPDAQIVLVIPRLSPEEGDPPSLGYSKTHVDAIYFLKRLAEGGNAILSAGKPMAVNVSLGMAAGPHDGRTPLERAFDKVVDDGYAQGFAVIKSAGNNAEHGLHARGHVSGGWQDISWSRADDPGRNRDYLEASHSSLDRIEFRLVDPQGRSTTICSEASPSVHQELGGNFVRLDLTPNHPHNGETRLVAVIDADVNSIQDGRWQLQFVAREQRSADGYVDL